MNSNPPTPPGDLLSRRGVLAAALAGAGYLAAASWARAATLPEGEIRAAESIHQEPVIPAARSRVYAVLTDQAKFDAMTRSLPEVKDAMAQDAAPAHIDAVAGGEFVLFAGIIFGRNLELVPNVRVVQAWRVAGWPLGVYSIARFELAEEGSGTRILFDHTGFPAGAAAHLASGWKAHYWDPLAAYLA